MEQIQADATQLSNEPFEPWILEVNDERRLPIFSSEARMATFASKISRDMNKVFGLGCVSTLLDRITKQLEVDAVDLNLFSKRSWEISVK